jgi:hypothetical protein
MIQDCKDHLRRNHALARTISLGTGLSCVADRHVAGQRPSSIAREWPPSTRSDPSIGHATGTLLTI